MFGLNPSAFHVFNLILHILSAILLFSLLKRMTGEYWKSLFVSALFAIHPVNAESVAWIAELNNVLSGFFFMLTLLIYSAYSRQREWKKYILAILAFAFGLLSKPVLMTLPFILLLLDLWPLKRIQIMREDAEEKGRTMKITGIPIFQLLMEKVPFMFLASLSLISNIVGANIRMGLYSAEAVPMGLRISNALVSYIKYLKNLFWPVDLAVYYPYPSMIPLWQVAGACVLLILITLIALRLVNKQPYYLVGWLWFLGGLVPFLGLVQSGFWPELADRYAYLTSLGIFIALTWGVSNQLIRWKNSGKILVLGGTIAVLVLMVLSWRQVGFWKNSETLFARAVSVTENNYLAHYDLGLALFNRGEIDGAINQFRQALSIKPDDIMVRNNLGVAMSRKNDIQGAIHQYKEVINKDPYHYLAYFNLAQAYTELRDFKSASEWYQKGLNIAPNDVLARNSLGSLFLSSGDTDGAVAQFRESLRINPHQADVFCNLGKAYIMKGSYKKAEESFQRAIQERPDHSEAQKGLKNVKTNQEQLMELTLSLNKMIEEDPDNIILYIKLGQVYRQQELYNKAIYQYNKALAIKSDSIESMYGLVLTYSDIKDYSKALDILDALRRIQPYNPEIDYNVACIYAKQNMAEESIRWLKQSLEKGFHKWELIEKDPDLENIRGTTLFNTFINEYKAN